MARNAVTGSAAPWIKDLFEASINHGYTFRPSIVYYRRRRTAALVVLPVPLSERHFVESVAHGLVPFVMGDQVNGVELWTEATVYGASELGEAQALMSVTASSVDLWFYGRADNGDVFWKDREERDASGILVGMMKNAGKQRRRWGRRRRVSLGRMLNGLTGSGYDIIIT